MIRLIRSILQSLGFIKPSPPPPRPRSTLEEYQRLVNGKHPEDGRKAYDAYLRLPDGIKYQVYIKLPREWGEHRCSVYIGADNEVSFGYGWALNAIRIRRAVGIEEEAILLWLWAHVKKSELKDRSMDAVLFRFPRYYRGVADAIYRWRTGFYDEWVWEQHVHRQKNQGFDFLNDWYDYYSRI